MKQNEQVEILDGLHVLYKIVATVGPFYGMYLYYPNSVMRKAPNYSDTVKNVLNIKFTGNLFEKRVSNHLTKM